MNFIEVLIVGFTEPSVVSYGETKPGDPSAE